MNGLTSKLYIDDELHSSFAVGDPAWGLDGDVLPEESARIQGLAARDASEAGKVVRLEVWDPDDETPAPVAAVVIVPDRARFN